MISKREWDGVQINKWELRTQFVCLFVIDWFVLYAVSVFKRDTSSDFGIIKVQVYVFVFFFAAAVLMTSCSPFYKVNLFTTDSMLWITFLFFQERPKYIKKAIIDKVLISSTKVKKKATAPTHTANAPDQKFSGGKAHRMSHLSPMRDT